MNVGDTITDGTAVFTVRSKKQNDVIQVMFDALYPIGIVVSSATNECPFTFGTWEEVAQNRVLQGGSNVGGTVEAGLPNITGTVYGAYWTNNSNNIQESNGAFYNHYFPLNGERVYPTDWKDGEVGIRRSEQKFNASRSSSIYGNSTTVQPPAYIVKFWQRIA